EDADGAWANKQERNFRFQHDRHECARGCDGPLQPILHPQFRKSIRGMQNESNDGWADTIEDCRYRFELTKIDIKGSKCGNDHEVRKDESPTPGLGSPKAAPQIGNESANQNSEWARQRLTYCYRLAHLLSCQPFALGNKLPLHLSHEGHRTSEPHEPQPQEVHD